MKIFDSHCHYNLLNKDYNWQEWWQEAQKAGIVASLNVGTNANSSKIAIEQSQQFPNLLPAIGIHPGEIFVDNKLKTKFELENQLQTIKHLITTNLDKIVALGEIGLDYFWIDSSNQKNEIIQLQKWLLRAQLELAQEHNLPVIFHMRDKNQTAYYDLLKILEEHQLTSIILHCVSGPVDYVQQVLSMGGYISVAGNITYKKSANLIELIKMASLDRILVETDSPYLAPQSKRGQPNHPKNIIETALFLVDNFDISLEQLYNNSLHAFKLTPEFSKIGVTHD